jgi:TonB family protein
MFAGAWLDVAVEKSRGEDFETTCAKLIRKFDHEVLETDRKRIRFPEPQPPPPETRRFGPGGGDSKVTNHCDIRPSLIHKLEPIYSKEGRKAKLQGTVLLHLEVDPTGNVVNPRVVRSLGLGLDEKAIEAVRQWRFRPGSSRDGKSVTCEDNIEVNCRLL